MQKKLFFIILFFYYLHADELFLIDHSVAIVYGPERKRIICQSDIMRKGLEGKIRTLADLILEELLFQVALHFKVPIEDEMVDRYIAAMQKQHNLTLKDIVAIFRASGYSYEEGREALLMMNVAHMMIDHNIKSRLFVSLRDIEEYYNTHPIVKPARYQLQIATIPFANHDYKQQRQEIITMLKQQRISVSWSEPFWINEDEIAENIEFITRMHPQQISKPIQTKQGFELYRLVSKKPKKVVSLKKRYREIAEILRKPKFEQLMKTYQQELIDDALIVYTH